MARNNTRTFGKNGGIFTALIVITCCCVIGMSLISYLILKGKIAESSVDLLIVVLLFCAVTIGGQVLLKTEERKITEHIVTGTLVIITMAAGGFMMDGGFCGVIRNLIVVGIACGLSALRSMKEPRKKRR